MEDMGTDDTSKPETGTIEPSGLRDGSFVWGLRLWGVALAVGLGAFLLVPESWGMPQRLLTFWNAVLLVDLATGLRLLTRSGPERTRAFARATDPGNVGLLAIAVVVSIVSVLSAVLLLAEPQPNEAALLNVLGIIQVVFAIFGGWAVLQMAYTFHYARLYYGRGDATPGLAFPEPPDALDFAYFAFGVGVSFQVSDVSVTTREMRRVVLVHSLLSFGFNAAILGLVVNLLPNRM